MFNRLLGFRSIQRKIEEKIIQLAFIPSKYLEALYVECNTKIHCHTLDILEVEERNVRSELLALMKEGQVDTKIEVEKFQLFERINGVSTKNKEIRVLMNEYFEKITEANYKRLVKLLKKSSEAGKLMHHSVKALYDNYDDALLAVEKLSKNCEEIISDLFEFRFCNEDGQCEYSFEAPEVLIGDAIRNSLQDMIGVGEKIIHMIRVFSYNHHQLKDKDETERVQSKEKT